MEYAEVLECPRIHTLAGVIPLDGNRERFRATYVENLSWAAEQAERAGVEVLVEPISQQIMPGIFLSRQSEAEAVVAEVGKPNLRVMFDLFHCQLE